MKKRNMRNFRKQTKRLAAGAMAGLMMAGTALTAVPYNVLADEVIMEWREENGVKYWYENGVRQGVKYREDGSIDASYRGKEIYDPSSNAWYWLDCVQNGAVAKDKDVYQESQADDAGNIGKWVRYDADGHMVKGWSEKDGSRYYFDPVYGTMAKGDTDIDGIHYYFNKDTGILESGGQTDDDGSKWIDGICKALVNGVVDENYSGVIDDEYTVGKDSYTFINGKLSKKTKYEDGAIYSIFEYNTDGKRKKDIYYFVDVENTIASIFEYDDNGNRIKQTKYNSDGSVNYYTETEYDANNKKIRRTCYQPDGIMSGVDDYDDKGNMVKSTYYNADGSIALWYEYEYNAEGKTTKCTRFYPDGTVEKVY